MMARSTGYLKWPIVDLSVCPITRINDKFSVVHVLVPVTPTLAGVVPVLRRCWVKRESVRPLIHFRCPPIYMPSKYCPVLSDMRYYPATLSDQDRCLPGNGYCESMPRSHSAVSTVSRMPSLSSSSVINCVVDNAVPIAYQCQPASSVPGLIVRASYSARHVPRKCLRLAAVRVACTPAVVISESTVALLYQ